MAPATPNSQIFEHEPLDHTKASIRLLRILPDLSDKGLIQCQMWHDTVDATYNCLSYVWGSDPNQRKILVNGKVFRVRKNLGRFMGAARTKYADPPQTFWIDAVCIDQNSIAERNHQVAQMGLIYSNAVEVVAWLGLSQGISRASAFWSELNALNPRTATKAWELWDHRNKQSKWQLEEDWKELANSQYWRRAWITQEILLARKFKILINDFEIELARSPAIGLLLPGIHNGGQASAPEGSRWSSGTRVFNTYLEALCGQRTILKERLITLLHELPRKGSHIPRDRIYSLLSVASDTASMPVDYGSSDYDVLIHLLDLFGNSTCLCFWSYVANILELQITPRSEEESGRKVPTFNIPLRPHYTYFKRSAQEARLPGEERVEHTFTPGQLCSCLDWRHLSLRVYPTTRGDKYTIQRDFDTPELDVVHVDIEGLSEVDNGGKSGCFFYTNTPRPLFNIHLTPGVLVRLFGKPNGRQTNAKHEFELCLNAREGRRPVVLHELV